MSRIFTYLNTNKDIASDISNNGPEAQLRRKWKRLRNMPAVAPQMK